MRLFFVLVIVVFVVSYALSSWYFRRPIVPKLTPVVPTGVQSDTPIAKLVSVKTQGVVYRIRGRFIAQPKREQNALTTTFSVRGGGVTYDMPTRIEAADGKIPVQYPTETPGEDRKTTWVSLGAFARALSEGTEATIEVDGGTTSEPTPIAGALEGAMNGSWSLLTNVTLEPSLVILYEGPK